MIVPVLAVALVAATLPVVVRDFYPPLPPGEGPDAGEPCPAAVLVPGSGRRPHGDGYRLNPAGLRRLEAGLHQARRHDLPLLLSGGAKGRAPENEALSEAGLMAAEARKLWPRARLLLEAESRNTWENARNSADLLIARGIDTVMLVTDRAHLPRAMLCFQAHGIRVMPMPVEALPAPAWLPSAAALAQVPLIWREWAALLWYHLKYRL